MEPNYNPQQPVQPEQSVNQQYQGYNFDPMTGEYIGQGTPPVEQPLPMNWFKFIIYFQLVFNAILNLANALTYFTGGHYGVDPTLIYEYYGDGLRYCDIFIALLCVGAAVYAYVVRYALSRYKSYAPLMYLGVWVLAAIPTIAYQVISTAVTGEANIDIVLWVQLIVTNGVGVVLHFIYFNKRKHLFNNPVGKKEATINVVSVTLFTLQVVSLFGTIVGGGFTNANPAFFIGFFLPTIIGVVLQIITTNKRKKERQMNAY